MATRRDTMQSLKYLGLCGLLLALLGCTAQQWQTTKDLALLSALVPLVILADMPAVPVTTCRTVTSWHRGVSTTTCIAY
jgi:hypothetical protein